MKDRAVESFVFWIVERKKKKKKRERSEGKIDRKGDRGRIRSDWGRTKILGEPFVRAGGIEVNKYSKKSRVPASGRRPTYNNHRSLQVSFAFQTFRSFILEQE